MGWIMLVKTAVRRSVYTYRVHVCHPLAKGTDYSSGSTRLVSPTSISGSTRLIYKKNLLRKFFDTLPVDSAYNIQLETETQF